MEDVRAVGGSGRVQGLVTVLLTLAGWTSIPLFLKYFTGDIDGWTANGWRYGISAVMWLPPLLLGWSRRSLPTGLWRAALVPSLWNIPAQVCFGLAPYYVEPGLMVFSMRLQIIFLFCGAALLFPSERRLIRSPVFILGALLVLGGTLATIALEPGGLGRGSVMGVGLSILAGLLYACYALSVRKYMMGMNPLVGFAAVNQITGAGLVLAMLVFARDTHTGGWNAGAGALSMGGVKFTWLVASAVIGIGLGHTFYFLSIKRLGLAVTTAVVQLQPVTVSIASLMIFGERMTALQWVTGMVAVAGAGVVLIAQQLTPGAHARAADQLKPEIAPELSAAGAGTPPPGPATAPSPARAPAPP